MRTLLAVLVLAATSLVAPLVPSRAQDPVVWTFQGRIYEGEVGDESRPLAGVTVGLYAANNDYPDPGELIDRTVTDGKGWYGLQVRESQTAYEVYSIREVDPQGYESAGATSVGEAGRLKVLD